MISSSDRTACKDLGLTTAQRDHPTLGCCFLEITLPDQSSNRITANIAHCLKFGGQLGWLIDPKDQSILILEKDQFPELCQGNDPLIVLKTIDLNLTANDVFGWLKLNNP